MSAPRGLNALARLHGIQTSYRAHDGRVTQASPESLMATLAAMGLALREAADIERLLRSRRRTLRDRALDPVVVAWADQVDGEARGDCRLRLPERLRDRPVRVAVELERGGLRTSAPTPEPIGPADPQLGPSTFDWKLSLPPVPVGYHRLTVEVGTGRERRRHEALLIAAPRRAAGWDSLPGGRSRRWGVFAPLYGVWDDRPDDGPDYGTLARLAERAADTGADVAGTLPLLAAFLDRPYDPSPYAPVSRLFWNALYVAPDAGTGAAAAVEAGPTAVTDGGSLSPGGHLDARALMAMRRPALEAEARELRPGADEMAAFRSRNPAAEDYARFRAVTERLGEWPGWPARLRARDLRPGDWDEDVARYHLYVQWKAERQLDAAARRAAERGVSLYLDLPLGVHPAGYDTWREPWLFALEGRAGAPPDPLAPNGQDWGFPPPHPESGRLHGHRYFIASIRSQLRYARVLRIDHVMQLHRMYWVADDPGDGVYVRYPAEELYAILCLESHRAGAVIVGEDLGTVPRETRRSMRRHGLPGMYVLQFELTEADRSGSADGADDRHPRADTPEAEPPALVPRPVPAGALAAIGTHDTPTFAGWWAGDDIRLRRELGQLGDVEAEAELAGRAAMRARLGRGLEREAGVDFDVDFDVEGAAGVEAALLRRLGKSRAGLVLATMEDLWLEREPQNVPGTASDRNWSRRLRRPLDALTEGSPARLLAELAEARAQVGEGNG